MTGNFIIFGGSGFIGFHLSKLIREKYNGNVINFDIQVSLQPTKETHEYIDVRKEIEPNYQASEEDIIINLAAVHRTPGHDNIEYFETNILGAKNVCDYARKHNIKTIVFTSSIATYGTYEAQKNEDSLPLPDIPYGISKLNAEYLHKIWLEEYKENRRLIILRPGVVYGFRENGNFTRLINSITKGSFFYPGRKDTIKACIYVKDLVSATMEMIEREPFGQFCIYNMTYEPAPTIEKICSTIAEVGKLKKPFILLPSWILLFIAKIVNSINSVLKISSKLNGIHPDRVKKLLISNDVNGQHLVEKYTLFFGLDKGLSDWMSETNFSSKKYIE